MRMFLEYDEHADHLQELVDEKPDEVIIASYGLYAGITYKGHDTTKWGEKYRLRTRDLLESMKGGPEVMMLIGAPTYGSCKGKEQCIACEMKYSQQLFRFVSHAELFPDFKWRVTTELHLKCNLFRYGENHWRGIAGGRNFTDSTWDDITFELMPEQITTLLDHTLKLWGDAEPATNETVGKMLEKQGISEQALVALVNVPK
jgi:hypothetical protein